MSSIFWSSSGDIFPIISVDALIISGDTSLDCPTFKAARVAGSAFEMMFWNDL
jgi:hypothetical protein